MLAELLDMCVKKRFALNAVPVFEAFAAQSKGRWWRSDGAIVQLRSAAEDVFQSGNFAPADVVTWWLVEKLLARSGEGDVAAAETAVDRLAAALPHDASGSYASSSCCGCARCWRGQMATRPAIATIGIATARWLQPRLRRSYEVGRGNAMTAAAPSGVVTFLFTDVEGSTRRWESDADGMRSALAAHDEVLRRAIEAHGGFLFKHTGDGVCAAFASPKSAVDAAITAQRRLELPVRMGLATGEAELREGDYFGTVLNRAARVMAAGHGGQILLADSTAVLLSGVDLLNLGPRRLRDVPMLVGVFQVRAPGLRTEFPPLRALDTTPGNLRPATTSLIGRESELGEAQAAVKAHRLVTLTGVGGVGKTRLALEVAARLADEFPDGVWVFELAAVTDPAAVSDAVAAVLGITPQPGKTVTESVAAALEGRIRLLVIDNCEHILDAAADLIDAILTQSATVRVLATSREVLGITEEQVRLVPLVGLRSWTRLCGGASLC